jgi:hypothetical protein
MSGAEKEHVVRVSHGLPFSDGLRGDGYPAEPCGMLHNGRRADQEIAAVNDVDLQQQIAKITVATLVHRDTLTNSRRRRQAPRPSARARNRISRVRRARRARRFRRRSRCFRPLCGTSPMRYRQDRQSMPFPPRAGICPKWTTNFPATTLRIGLSGIRAVNPAIRLDHIFLRSRRRRRPSDGRTTDPSYIPSRPSGRIDFAGHAVFGSFWSNQSSAVCSSVTICVRFASGARVQPGKAADHPRASAPSARQANCSLLPRCQ